MGIPLSSNFDLNAGLPLDARVVVADLTARDAIATIQRYNGLLVYVQSNRTNYQLQGGITNADWISLLDTASVLPFQVATFANPLNIDCTTYKDWICEEITGNTTVNLNNTSNGDAGMLELIMDSVGHIITLGTMFTKRMGPQQLNLTAGADNIISWRKVGETDIAYTISGGSSGWVPIPDVLPFQTADFANPLDIDCTTYKDWACTITGDTTINIFNTTDGDAGMLELIIALDSSEVECVVAFGTGWTKRMGTTLVDGMDGTDNIISWRKAGASNIVYTIAQIET